MNCDSMQLDLLVTLHLSGASIQRCSSYGTLFNKQQTDPARGEPRLLSYKDIYHRLFVLRHT